MKGRKNLGLPKPWEHPAVVGKHVVSMTRDYEGGATISVATCQCGWCSRVEVGPGWGHKEQDDAVFFHWRDVIDEDVAAKRKRKAA
ncbi:hypothetical protein HNQ36_001108 [Afipia massiliensis]|uniref:Uncharacterized protein n=1 Tax=Afipia massiliensis TaxID=211460 RepID=A0A840MXL0_9BRAD|nr:hypothetical protein [Afipia massiliensis]MBB5051154.1 hypothetical protein [Afipia massiliensis]